jgi:hypothetical protein
LWRGAAAGRGAVAADLAPAGLDDPTRPRPDGLLRRDLDPAVSSDATSTTRRSWCGMVQVVRRGSGATWLRWCGADLVVVVVVVRRGSGVVVIVVVVRRRAVVVGFQAAGGWWGCRWPRRVVVVGARGGRPVVEEEAATLGARAGGRWADAPGDFFFFMKLFLPRVRRA